jgi:Ribbon-helix-helix protein, copG family
MQVIGDSRLAFGLPFKYDSKMPKQSTEKVRLKRKRGRPATGNDPMMGLRMPDELKAEIDEWAASQDDKPSRSAAIRRLIEQALAAAPKRGRGK